MLLFLVDNLLNAILHGQSLVENAFAMDRELSSRFILTASLWASMFNLGVVPGGVQDTSFFIMPIRVTYKRRLLGKHT